MKRAKILIPIVFFAISTFTISAGWFGFVAYWDYRHPKPPVTRTVSTQPTLFEINPSRKPPLPRWTKSGWVCDSNDALYGIWFDELSLTVECVNAGGVPGLHDYKPIIDTGEVRP
jgi:hypothetical protein